MNIDTLDPKHHIIIKGARVHNLKNLSVAIPRNKLVVVTGLSGSGKSSLAFDTLYAEGQRRYVESLSSYARQFLGRIEKPEVDFITGISPAIAIEQKVYSSNSRSTVGTSTEIYDYLKLLYARIGITFSPISGNEVKKHTVTDVIDFINLYPDATKIMIVAPCISSDDIILKDQLNMLLQRGISRLLFKESTYRIDEALTQPSVLKAMENNPGTLRILIDRLTVKKGDEPNDARMGDSINTAFYEGEGTCLVVISDEGNVYKEFEFSNHFELDGFKFEEPSVHMFSFNNPFGACKACQGFGTVIGIDEDLVIPDKNLSVYEDAIACWRGEKMQTWKTKLVMTAHVFEFPIHRPYKELTPKQKRLLWTGNEHFDGLNEFFRYLESEAYKIQYRVLLSRFRGKTGCPDCNGSRLRKDAAYVKINGKSISEIVLLPVNECLDFFKTTKLTEYESKVAKRLLLEVVNRLQFLNDVGLGYLTLNRLSSSLSGGESQRINLATSLGSSLVGSMYILDEPSIGLHPRDTVRLIKVLKSLRDLGNTVIVVEHDEEIMKAADQIIDIGPLAGVHGGELIFQGNHEQIAQEVTSMTARYLNGTEKIVVPLKRRPWKEYIEVIGARENNLKNIDVKFPLGVMTVVTGVSGSGKSSLIKKVLYPSLKKMCGGHAELSGHYDTINGHYHSIADVEFVDQNPIGKSSRSNPVTYVKAYDEIRNLFAGLPMSKLKGYKPAHFSFNVDSGRCEECEGEGEIKVEMQFMADVKLLCESCNGRRFKEDVLEVEHKGKNIYDILCLTVDEAIDFFSASHESVLIEKKIVEKLKPLSEVGLGYVQLGQSSSTLSGGESQRIKLASFLSKGRPDKPMLFIFDEPTTGLHFHDINKLLYAFNALIDQGNSIIIIEHNGEVIKNADWIIDLGADGGDAGGNIVFEGTPENLVKCKDSYTGKYLLAKLN